MIIELILVLVFICFFNNLGVLFCYLLFLIDSGLLVYVNGVFVVVFNRCFLKEKMEDYKDCIGVEWNDIFLKDLVCVVYFEFVIYFKLVVNEFGSGYLFYFLWLRDCKVLIVLKFFLCFFYENFVYKNIFFF